MVRLIGKTLKIVTLETFYNYRFKVIINLLILLLMIGFQFGDLTLKISSNYFVVSWISFNTYYIFSVLNKENRRAILHVSQLSMFKKLILQYSVALVMNLTWFLVMLLHLVIIMGSQVMNAFIIAFVQLIFAVALGSFAGMINKKFGAVLIAALTLFNFIMYNPLVYEASGHFLSISEQLHAIHEFNYVNFFSLCILSLSLILFVYFLSNQSRRGYKKKLMLVLGFMIALYALLIHLDLMTYKKENAYEYLSYTYGDKQVYYKSISKSESEDIVNLIHSIEDKYKQIQSDFNYSTYTIEKQYLSKVSWIMRKESPQPIQVEGQTLQINILSNSMINFDEAIFSQNLMKEIQLSFSLGVNGYKNSRFTRHLVDGFSIAILSDVSNELEIKNALEVERYYKEYVMTMKALPANEHTYVKRIALEIYQGFPKQMELLYQMVICDNPKNDDEFLMLLEENFTEIYNDPKVQDILNSI